MANQVSLSEGMTLNLGDYQSYRVEVGVTLDFSAGHKEGAYREAQKFVQENLSRRLDEVCHEMKLKSISVPQAGSVRRVNRKKM